VSNFVAMAWQEGSSGVNLNGAVKLAVPENYHRTKNYDYFLRAAGVITV